MAKSKARKKVKRRSKGGGRSVSKRQGKKATSKSGSMMNMRSGFKGIAGSVMGKQSTDKKTNRVVNVFWWVVTIVLGIAAAVIFYQRFGK